MSRNLEGAASYTYQVTYIPKTSKYVVVEFSNPFAFNVGGLAHNTTKVYSAFGQLPEPLQCKLSVLNMLPIYTRLTEVGCRVTKDTFWVCPDKEEKTDE